MSLAKEAKVTRLARCEKFCPRAIKLLRCMEQKGIGIQRRQNTSDYYVKEYVGMFSDWLFMVWKHRHTTVSVNHYKDVHKL